MKLRKDLTQVSTFFLYRLARIVIRKGEEVLSPAPRSRSSPQRSANSWTQVASGDTQMTTDFINRRDHKERRE